MNAMYLSTPLEQEIHPCGVALDLPGDMLPLQCWTALERLSVEHDSWRIPLHHQQLMQGTEPTYRHDSTIALFLNPL